MKPRHWIGLRELLELYWDKICNPSEIHLGDYFIAGHVDNVNKEVGLLRANLRSHKVPFSMFHDTLVSSPDFNQFKIIDWGHAIALGDYEASTMEILHDVDFSHYNRRWGTCWCHHPERRSRDQSKYFTDHPEEDPLEAAKKALGKDYEILMDTRKIDISDIREYDHGGES